MSDAWRMLVAAEVVRHWLSRSALAAVPRQGVDDVATPWPRTMLAAIPRSAIVLAFVADAMGL